MNSKKKPKFFRRAWNKVIRIGKQSKKKRKWRRAYGIDNKMRLKEKAYGKMPSIGYGADRKDKGKIDGSYVVRVESVKELEKIEGKEIIIGKVGKRKRQEIIKKANEMKLKILNKYPKEKVKKVEEKDKEKKDATS